jgi:hypothetical protein
VAISRPSGRPGAAARNNVQARKRLLFITEFRIFHIMIVCVSSARRCELSGALTMAQTQAAGTNRAAR